jgi:hypothetical protein
VRYAHALTIITAVTACDGDDTPADAGVHEDAAAQDDAATPEDASADAGGGDAAPDYLVRLDTTADFVAMSRAQSVKYILRVDGAAPRAPLLETCYFQNTARYQFHIEFLHTFPDLAGLTFQDYEALVLRSATRIWWGGGVLRLQRRHPISGEPESLGYQIYAENGAVVGLREADVIEVDRLLKSCMPYAERLLAFYPGDPFQEQFARQKANDFMQRGIAVILP